MYQKKHPNCMNNMFKLPTSGVVTAAVAVDLVVSSYISRKRNNGRFPSFFSAV